MGKRQFRMYTQELPICIPEICVAVYAFRSALNLFSQTVRISFGEHGAVWFLLWWLFLHRRLRPRQRGFNQACARMKRLTLPCGRSFPQGATRFYPGAQESLAAFPSKPFGFSAECQSGMTAACLSPRTLRHRNVRLSPRWSRRPQATRLRLWVIRFPSKTVKQKIL
jgi:hypothetical protein